MTREEAIQELQTCKDLIRQDGLTYLDKRDIPLLNTAIEALSVEIAQGVGRYENAMQKLREMPKYLNGIKAKQIKKTSSEAVQGEWITIDTEVTSVPAYWNEEQRQSDERGAGILEKCECSVCGWKTNFMGYKKLGVNKSYNFCPNCGARMTREDGEAE